MARTDVTITEPSKPLRQKLQDMLTELYTEVETDFFIEVARGNKTGMSSWRVKARNNDIDSGSGFEDIWAGGGTRGYLSSVETMDVVSDSTADDLTGTGARTLTIYGLLAGAEVEETVDMDGTTTVTTTQTFDTVHEAVVASVGSGDTNAGEITIDPTTSGSGSRQASISAGDGATLISHRTIPAGKKGYIVGEQLSVAAGSGTGVKNARLRLLKQESGGSWMLEQDFALRSDGTSTSADTHFTIPEEFTAGTKLRWEADAENNNTSVYVQYNVLLIDD